MISAAVSESYRGIGTSPEREREEEPLPPRERPLDADLPSDLLPLESVSRTNRRGVVSSDSSSASAVDRLAVACSLSGVSADASPTPSEALDSDADGISASGCSADS